MGTDLATFLNLLNTHTRQSAEQLWWSLDEQESQ